jgi:hypothetical protein
MAYKPWTQEEINLLLAKKRIPTRSKKSVRMKMINLGLSKPKFTVRKHNKKTWSEEELNLLKLGKSIPSRTENSIKTMRRRLGLVEIGTYRKPWKKKEENLLKKLVKEGNSAKQIFLMKVLPYSRNSIQKKMCFMGLAKKSPNRNIFSKEELNEFKVFLRENWIGKTPQELSDIWNEKNNTKVTRGKVVYHLTSLNIKISYGEVQKINRLRKKEQNIKNSLHKNAKLMDENIRLARVKIMQSRLLKGKDIWTGLPSTEDISI